MSAGVGRLTLVEASLPFEALTGPAVHPRTETVVAGTAETSKPAGLRPARRQSAARAASSQAAAAPASSPSPQSPPQSATPQAPAPVNTVDTTLPVTRGSDELPGVPQTAEVTRPLEPPATPEAAAPGRAPWNVAADAGKAVGRKSRDASVATAGFFSRFAKSVAGSF
jgi:hypothetical protein